MTRLARRKAFTCLHRYAVDAWSDEKNLSTFGACFTPHGHGHNYELEAYFEGPVDPVTGMVMNLIDVDRLLEAVVAPLEGRHLNCEVEAFRDVVPTSENLARHIFNEIRARANHLPAALVKLRVFESPDLWVDVWS